MNLDELLDWDTIDLESPEIDAQFAILQNGRKTLQDILDHLDSENSTLNYTDKETLRALTEESMVENMMLIELFEKVIALRDIERLGNMYDG